MNVFNFPLHFKLKNRIGMTKEDDVNETTAEKFQALIRSINFLAYYMGIEFVNGWHFSFRSHCALMMECVCWWLLVYTFVVEFPTTKCIEVQGGAAFTATVYDFVKSCS